MNTHICNFCYFEKREVVTLTTGSFICYACMEKLVLSVPVLEQKIESQAKALKISEDQNNFLLAENKRINQEYLTKSRAAVKKGKRK